MRIVHFLLSILIITGATSAYAIGVGLNIKDTGNNIHAGRPSFLSLLQRLAGTDLIFDTAVAKNMLFNYRLNIECDSTDTFRENLSFNNSYNVNRFTCANTFGFGLFRTNSIRLWVGPQIAFCYEFKHKDNSISDVLLFNRFGSVVGLNVHARDNITLCFETGLRGGFGIDLSKTKPNVFTDSKIEPIIGFRLIFRSRDTFFPAGV
jgi:hypothetical protein